MVYTRRGLADGAEEPGNHGRKVTEPFTFMSADMQSGHPSTLAPKEAAPQLQRRAKALLRRLRGAKVQDERDDEAEAP